MVDLPKDKETLLREEFHGQTAHIRWHDLQTYYAHGAVVSVGTDLDLVEVAVQLGMDNTERFEQWIAEDLVAPVADDQALAWYELNQELWAVVAPPWVLVQKRDEGTSE